MSKAEEIKRREERVCSRLDYLLHEELAFSFYDQHVFMIPHQCDTTLMVSASMKCMSLSFNHVELQLTDFDVCRICIDREVYMMRVGGCPWIVISST